MTESPLERLNMELYSGPEFVENPADRAREATVRRSVYRSVLRDLGIKHNVIPERAAGDLITNDDLPEPKYIGNAKSLVGPYVNRAMNRLTDYFRYKEGAIPFHWGKVKVSVEELPGWYVLTRDGVKKIAGVNGSYNPETAELKIDKALATGNYIGMDEKDIEYTATHEGHHSIQDYSGTIEREMKKRDEKEARDIIEANADMVSGTNAYRKEQKKYRNLYGDTDITNYTSSMKKYNQDMSKIIDFTQKPDLTRLAA